MSSLEAKNSVYVEITECLSFIIPHDQSNMSSDEKQGRQMVALQILKDVQKLRLEINGKYTDAISKRLKHFESKGLTPSVRQYMISSNEKYDLADKIAEDNEFWSCKIYHHFNSLSLKIMVKKLEFVKERFKWDDNTCYAAGKFYCFECWLNWDGYMIEKDDSKYVSKDGFKVCVHKYAEHKMFVDKKEYAVAKYAMISQKLENAFDAADMKIGDYPGLQELFSSKIPAPRYDGNYINSYLCSLDVYDKYVDNVVGNIAFVKELIRDGYWEFIPDNYVCVHSSKGSFSYATITEFSRNPCKCVLPYGWKSHSENDRVICSKALILSHAHESINNICRYTLQTYKKILMEKKTDEICKMVVDINKYGIRSLHISNCNNLFGSHIQYVFLQAERIKRHPLNITEIERTPMFDYFYGYLTVETKDGKHTSFYQDLSKLTAETMPAYLDDLAERDDLDTFKLVGPVLIQHFTSASFVSKLIGLKKVNVAIETDGKAIEIKTVEKKESDILKYLYSNGMLFTCPDHMLVKLIMFDVNLYMNRKVQLYYLTSTYNDLNIIWEHPDMLFANKFNIMCSWCFKIAPDGLITNCHYQLSDSTINLMTDGFKYLQAELKIDSLCDMVVDQLFEPGTLYVDKRHYYLCEWFKMANRFDALTTTFKNALINYNGVRLNLIYNSEMTQWIYLLDKQTTQNTVLKIYQDARASLTELEAMTEFDDKEKFNQQVSKCIKIFTLTIKNLPHLHCNDEMKRLDTVVVDKAEAYWFKKKVEMMKVQLVQVETKYECWKGDKKDICFVDNDIPDFVTELKFMEETFNIVKDECSDELKRIDSINDQVKDLIRHDVQVLIRQLNEKLIESDLEIDSCTELKNKMAVFDDKASLDTFIKGFIKFKLYIDRSIDNMDMILSFRDIDL